MMMCNDRGADCYVQGDAAATLGELLELLELLERDGVSGRGFRTGEVRRILGNAGRDPAEFEIEPGTVDPREAVQRFPHARRHHRILAGVDEEQRDGEGLAAELVDEGVEARGREGLVQRFREAGEARVRRERRAVLVELLARFEPFVVVMDVPVHPAARVALHEVTQERASRAHELASLVDPPQHAEEPSSDDL